MMISQANLVVEFAPTLAGCAYVEACNLQHTREFVASLTEDAIETHAGLLCFSVKEGYGMYLAPDDRIVIW